jgi:DNA-binding GntR family transcriptional regulator
VVRARRFGSSSQPRGDASLSDRVYELLRAAIIQGEIRPNQRLVEAELARQLNVSRTPVREGLQHLARDGLVMGGRDGWLVREHTAAEIQEIYETRVALEGFASWLAAGRATDEMLETIARIHRGTGKGSDISRAQLVEVNNEFHNAIVRASANQRLIDLIQRNREFYFNYGIAELFTDEEVAASVRGHEAILEALLDRDSTAAEDMTRQHILESVPIILSRLRLPPERAARGLAASPVEQGR